MSQEQTFTKLKMQLEEISAQKIDKQDYQGRIIRWNNYILTLQKIRDVTRRLDGVRLDVKRSSNYKTWGQRTWLKAGPGSSFNGPQWRNLWVGFCGICGILGLIYGLQTNLLNGLAVGAPFLIWLSWFAYDAQKCFIKPEVLHIKISPEIHVDEFAYARNMIKELPPIQRDPIIRLPSIELSIPRQWLAQESMRHLMNQMENIKL